MEWKKKKQHAQHKKVEKYEKSPRKILNAHHSNYSKEFQFFSNIFFFEFV